MKRSGHFFNPKSILITGASGEIGGAIARRYARPGVTLILHGRDVERLSSIGNICSGHGATVVLGCFDLTDINMLQEWASDVDSLYKPDLLIVNHGVNINIGVEGKGESWLATDRLLDVNLRSGFALIHAIVGGMRQRRFGQVAIISSLAAYFGLPRTPSYCATKSALKAYGESLRGWLAPEGIGVTVVMPGYVDSRMCDEMPGPKPFIWSAERAARKITLNLAHNPARITFPLPLNVGAWCLAILPANWSIRILRWLGYGN